MALYQVLLAVLLVSPSLAFFFRRQAPTATSDGREIEESCLELADQGSCEFYTCFERRLPCGRDWYMLKIGHYYCNKMERQMPEFTEEGQNFLEDAKRCITRSLKEFYEREYIDCHQLEHEAISAITPCFLENGFCNVFPDNAEEFFRIYEFTDLFTRGAGKVWREMLSLATQCGGQALQEFSSNTGEGFIDSINGFFNSLSGK